MVADKSGLVKEEAFFTILKLHGVELKPEAVARLKRDHSRASKINFTDAITSLNIDLDAAILNEEKWVVAKQQKPGKVTMAENSLIPSKAVTHLSRMSLQEFEQRQGEMRKEIDGDDGKTAAGAKKQNAADGVSRAGSTVSKPVQDTNAE